MADSDVVAALNKAFSGLGVDENSLVKVLSKSHADHRRSFRKANPHMFSEDERSFERWNDDNIESLQNEFLRFKNAMVLWAMHPWERDARIIKEALRAGPEAYSVIIEVACTRTSEEIYGARRAYHSLYDLSVEEDVATNVKGSGRKLLVALVSAYRYEGPKVNEEAVKSDSKILAEDGRNDPLENEEVIRILSTRSKLHLKAVYNSYTEACGKTIVEDLDPSDKLMKAAIECLCIPHAYFSQVLFDSKQTEADQRTKTSLTRIIVTRADVDIEEIKEEYNKMHGVSLSQRIDETANGNYKEFMLALITKE